MTYELVLDSWTSAKLHTFMGVLFHLQLNYDFEVSC